MNVSILGMIHDFVKEKNITVGGAYIKFSNKIPEAFYDSVINYMRNAKSNYIDNPKLDGFYVQINEKKDISLHFIGNGNTKVIVVEEGKFYEGLPSAKIIKEQTFLDSIKSLDEDKNKEIMDSLPDEFKYRFIKDEKQTLTINQIFYSVGFNIIEYIKYLDDEKKNTIELLKKELEEQKEIEKIFFDEAEASSNVSKTTKSKTTVNIVRKNDEIPIEERTAALDSFNPVEEFEAISSNSTSIYYVKVFTVKNKYKLVMEPKEGTKYTKIVHIDKDKLDKKELEKIVIDSLELTRDETTKQPNITRHSHTTLEEYKKLLSYLIHERKEGLNYSTIRRIDEASNYKKR